MSYRRQDIVNRELHRESLTALDKLADVHQRRLQAVWLRYRRELVLAISDAYRQAAPTGRWALAAFKMQAAGPLQAHTRSILEQFHAVSKSGIKEGLNAIYNQSLLRHAWILDQVTPASYRVTIPHRQALHESAVSLSHGAEWSDRWGSWVDAYQSALMHNLTLGALNGSSIEDAQAEVDATKANTPAYGLSSALQRLFDFESVYAMSQGQQDIGEFNGDAVEEEIWKTRGDLRVCDFCDEQEGLTIEEAEGVPPAHPNCHCYTLMVPKSYADLLRSGDASDKELARELDDRGLVPNSLVIRDPSGDVAAKAIVDFDPWVKGQGAGVFSR